MWFIYGHSLGSTPVGIPSHMLRACRGLARFRLHGGGPLARHRVVPSSIRTMETAAAEEALRPRETFILARESNAEECALSSGAWLAQAPRGAYTTCRTFQGTSVFELSFHIDRLATSSRLMIEADKESGSAPHVSHPSLTDAGALRPRLLSSLRQAISAFRSAADDTSSELKITILITWDAADFHIYTHVSSLGPRPSPPVKVQVRGAPRHNAQAKDSEWVRQRREYEDLKPADVNEVLLADADGAIYEGLSSNFFALIDGRLWTAGEGVLLGSVREAVLRVCGREGVPVELSPPSLEQLERWEGAFVSSTSRLLLPVDEISLPDAEPPVAKVLPRSELASRLEAAVMQEVAACSEPVF